MSLNKTNQNRRWIFKNSVKLNLKRLDKPISHKVLFSALDVVLNQVENDAITNRPERKNGVRRVRISFPKEVENIIGSLSGPTIMYGLKCVVSIVGQKQKCYFCDDEGHNIAKCPWISWSIIF
ncbi:hypothetical protein BpHYR1_018106 [Brachionus plicatilis]|uniref:CCHC-type domain-containing protein n=1 Tax=Brachionus plicatilis TaxID=10195 RepID=A0A3M7T1Y1_BRAPC|nr:hypothetical protein BpHYR1_018106 [Brachionus plicatilis]